MYTNTAATLWLYTKKDKSFKRFVTQAFWDEQKTVIMKNTGAEKAMQALILIPYDPSVTIEQNAKSRIVKGVCDFEVETEADYTNLVKEIAPLLITSVDLKLSGSKAMHHWELGAV